MGVVICLVPPSPSPDAGERRVGAEGAVSGAGAAGAIRECPTRLHGAGLAGAGDTPAIMPSWRSRGWGHLTQIRRLQHSTFPQKFPGLPGPDWRSRVGGATGETAGRRKRIIRRDGASRSRGERAPRFSVPPLGPAPRRHSTSFLPRPASETARASEATSEITEPRPSEGTWLAHGNPGTGISSPAQNPLPRLSLPTVTLPDTLPPPPPAGPRHSCADRCALPVAGALPPPGPHPTNSLWSPLPGW